MRALLAVALLTFLTNSHADECESIISLSKTVSTIVQDKNSVDTHTATFCNEYYQAKSTGKSMDATASYKFLSASYGRSQVSHEEVASKYCSANANYSRRDDAYKQYVETISPNAYSAYEQCIAMSRRDIRFSLDAGSLLPKEFSMTVSYRPTSNASASLALTASEDVTCIWSQSAETIFVFNGAGSADLICKRNDQTRRSFVKVTRIDGSEKLTFPWQRFDSDGNPVDSLFALQTQNSELTQKIIALEQGLKSSVVAFANDSCPEGWMEYAPAYGRFIRGIDKQPEAVDPDGPRNPGHIQEDSFQAHQHKVQVAYGAGGHPAAWSMTHNSPTSGAEYEKMKAEGGSETRPKNVALLYCIKN